MADQAFVDLTVSPSTQVKSIPHRLPTVSASEALQDLATGSSNFIKTGLPSLDSRLAGAELASNGGFERGKVTEIWGPSGAGKTAIALQAATYCIDGGSSVLWIDASTALDEGRVRAAHKSITSFTTPAGDTPRNFDHVEVPTLSHLLALILHPLEDSIPSKAGLLVVDGLNCLMDIDYPRYQIAASNKTEAQKWQAGRRYAVLGSIVSALSKLAVINKMAVVVTTGCATRMRHDSGLGAALVPGIGGLEWESGIWNRIVVFRDFTTRLVGVQKCQGRSAISREEVGEPGHLIAFEIGPTGSALERIMQKGAEVTLVQPVKSKASPVKPRKRTIDEIADSEGEDIDEYGWADADDGAFTGDEPAIDGDTSTTSAQPD